MRKLTFALLLLGLTCTAAMAQKTTAKKATKDTTVNKNTDSTVADDGKDPDNIPIVSMDDNDLEDASTQNVSSVLTAGRDPYFSAASYNFNAVRFRVRGYNGDLFNAYMNGVPMENLDNGFTPFGLWGGLNDVMRNKDVSVGLKYNTFAFGDLGSSTNIDSRASKQRKQTEVDYAYSNRSYTHKIGITHSTGISKKGWAFTFSGSRRYADEGYIPGTYYDGLSYFIGVDKRVGQKTLFSMVFFGAPTENGKQGSAIEEARQLTGSNYYNPYWGYQNGKKRNANIGKTNQPVLILTEEHRFNNKTTLTSAVSISAGTRSASSLDWYNAADPRPDYYRYLPSYQDDTTIRAAVTNEWMNNPSVSQVNWAKLYDANRNNIQNFNGTAGKRAMYMLSENVTESKRVNYNLVLNSRLGKNIEFTGGASYQWMKNNYYKQITDLLGADYHVDLNQFAERSYPNNPNANQNDMNRPNRIVKVGDRYSYDYDITIIKATAWAQAVLKFQKFDFFVASEFTYTDFWRTGNVKNGLFPTNSFGKSSDNEFNNIAIKAGATYKLNGINYFYVNGSYLTKAPFYDNVYVSVRTRDVRQDEITNETIKSLEGGYVLNAPKLKLRLTGYYTEFQNQMDVMSFYHDTYQNFVNYALTGINKLHFGGEFGFEAKVMPNVTINGAASIARFYYNSRQKATVTLDNDASVLSRDTVYSQNFRVGGTPQEAYTFGVRYQSPKFWSVSLNGNYFDQMWLDINPLRRTYSAVDGVAYKSDLWNGIIDQQKFNSQFTLDFYGTYSYKLPKSMGFKKNVFLVLSAGISNLLDNQNIITGGYEQLRFDFKEREINKFPNKYYYSYGLNYSLSAALRF
jgi:hypothetical protein